MFFIDYCTGFVSKEKVSASQQIVYSADDVYRWLFDDNLFCVPLDGDANMFLYSKKVGWPERIYDFCVNLNGYYARCRLSQDAISFLQDRLRLLTERVESSRIEQERRAILLRNDANRKDCFSHHQRRRRSNNIVGALVANIFDNKDDREYEDNDDDSNTDDDRDDDFTSKGEQLVTRHVENNSEPGEPFKTVEIAHDNENQNDENDNLVGEVSYVLAKVKERLPTSMNAEFCGMRFARMRDIHDFDPFTHIFIANKRETQFQLPELPVMRGIRICTLFFALLQDRRN